MQRVFHATTNTAWLAVFVAAFLASCGSQVEPLTVPPDSGHPPPTFSAALPELPDGSQMPRGVNALYDGEFTAADEYISVGAKWGESQLNLGANGLTFAVLGTLAPVYNTLGVTLDGELNGLWLAVSDYPRGCWRWLAGPLNGSTIVAVPAEVRMSPAGAVYILLACPDAAWAELELSRSFAFDVVRPPPGLGEWPVVPEELSEAYQDVLDVAAAYPDESLFEFTDTATIAQRRAMAYYAFTHDGFIDHTKVQILTWPADRGQYAPLLELIVRQLDARIISDFYLMGMHFFVVYFGEDYTRAELAWIADWGVQHYPASVRGISGLYAGGPAP